MEKLRVVAAASSEESRSKLHQELKALNCIEFDGVVIELSDAYELWKDNQSDLVIIEMTGREHDACLFIETISYGSENKAVVFALHRELDPRLIQKAVSSGAREFIQYPQGTDELKCALQRKWRQLQEQAPRKNGRVIPVYSMKGGSGSSTIAVNLAHQLLSTSQKKVALLDMDQVSSNTPVLLNLKANYALSDLSGEKITDVDDDLLKKIIIEHPTGVDIVVSSKGLLDENPLVTQELIKKTIDYLVEHYDFILVDLPSHTLDEHHQYFVVVASDVLVVSSLDIPSVYHTRQYLDFLRRHADMDKVKLIVNRYDLKAAIGISNDNLEEEYRNPIFHRLPNNWQLNVESMSMGQTMGTLAPNDELVRAFNELAVKLVEKKGVLLH